MTTVIAVLPVALNRRALKLLAPYLSNAKVLSLGYPDLLIPDTEFLGVTAAEFVDNGAWHGMPFKLPETRHVFSLLGSTLDCIDIHASRGCERVVDLNHPCSLDAYDLVIDAGTVEHCFNIGQALMNAANAVKHGGRIFHCSPMSMCNHGFYNLCPTLFNDFYGQNGFDVVHLSGITADKQGPVAATERWSPPIESSILCVAQRIEVLELSYPTQSKYLKHPDLH